VNRAHIEKMRTRKLRRQAQSASRRAAKERGSDSPLNLGPHMRRKRKGEITPPPLSSTRETPPPFSDIVSQ
jgi:hypothetical protein